MSDDLFPLPESRDTLATARKRYSDAWDAYVTKRDASNSETLRKAVAQAREALARAERERWHP